ncbi:MAG: hypothetical protein KGM17_02770 [Sphingomonadales bacterium]|nr:hypothetical protein [Sphingomonadales bacterium]
MHPDNLRLRLAVFLVAIAAAAFCVGTKGPNLDEFWTVIFTDPRVGLGQAWFWWSADTPHPPGYYALVRLWLTPFGASVTAVRGLNLAIWTVLAGYWLFAPANGSAMRRFCLSFVLAVSVTFFTLERLAEARAYFPAFALVCVLLVELRRLDTPGRAGGALARIAAATIAIALFDYPIFCAAAGVLLVAGGALLLAGRRADARGIGAALGAGALVMAAGMVNALGYEHVVVPYDITTATYAKFAAEVVVAGLAGNLALSWLAARGLPAGLPELTLRTYDFRIVALVAAVGAVFGFLVLNLALHAILSRHLIPITALVCAAVTAWLPERAWSRAGIAAMLIAFAGSALLVSWRIAAMDNLHRFADRLAAAQRHCPAYTVIPVDMFALGKPASSVNGETRALASRFGQLAIAHEAGITLAPAEQRRVDPRCGGAVWFVPGYPAPGATAASLLDVLKFPLTPAQRAGSRLLLENTVLVLEVPGAALTPRQGPL